LPAKGGGRNQAAAGQKIYQPDLIDQTSHWSSVYCVVIFARQVRAGSRLFFFNLVERQARSIRRETYVAREAYTLKQGVSTKGRNFWTGTTIRDGVLCEI
jgi:hypothetical protein